MIMEYISSELAVEIFPLFNKPNYNLPVLKSDKILNHTCIENELFSKEQCDISYIFLLTGKYPVVSLTTLTRSVTDNSHIMNYLVDLPTDVSIVILQI